MMLIFVTSVLLFALTLPCHGQTDDGFCQSTSDCKSGYCCTLGPIRYSIPQCRAFQKEGEVCRPGNVSMLNVTLAYPDNSQIELKDAHFIFCPCAIGLTCDTKEGICKDVGEKANENRLSNENDK